MVADGINHAVPTHKELQSSLYWLTNQGLSSRIGNKYELTSKGRLIYEAASINSNSVFKIWEVLEQAIRKLCLTLYKHYTIATLHPDTNQAEIF